MNAEVKAATINTVAFEGRISVNNSDEMRRKLLAALRSRPAQVTVDISQVTYMDSSGLATLLEAVGIARNQSTRLVLGELSGQPRQLFEVGNLHGLFEFARAGGPAFPGPNKLLCFCPSQHKGRPEELSL